MRDVVGDDERSWNGDNVQSAGERAESCNGDADGDVGDGRDEIGVGDGHGDGGKSTVGNQCNDFA
jgi:hypothetical protein